MTEPRPPYLQAALAALAAFALYAITLAPTTWFWDTSEYIATAHILGIPHPPGNPLFVVVGRAWSLILGLFGFSVPVRINLLAAATSAAATGFFFLVTHRILKGWIERERGTTGSTGTTGAKGSTGSTGARSAAPPTPADSATATAAHSAADSAAPWEARIPMIGAWAGALLGATSYTVWNQSNVNEKVYTLSVLVIALVSWLAIRWRDRKDDPGAGWYLVLALYVMVLGSTNHLMSLLPAPALGLLILRERPQVLWNPSIVSRGILAVLLGLSFNFFLPLRSAEQPRINEGEPICETLSGAAVAVFTNGRAGCPALAANLQREQYGKPPISADPTDPRGVRPRSAALLGHQVMNYFQYFDWQWARGASADPLPGNARLPITLLFLGLGLGGLMVAWRSGSGSGIYMGTLAVTLTVILVFYLNFKYGFTLGEGVGAPREMREVRERDYFFIASFHLWGFLAAMGLVGGWRWAAGRVPEARGYALATPILLVAFVPLVLNWGWADRRGDWSARDWAWNLLQSVEPYGLLFTNGDNDTFPLWYMQEVEGVRQDVTVIVVQYLYTQWYPRQLSLHTRPENQRPFVAEPETEGFRGGAPRPTRAITRLADEELNRVDSGLLPQDLTLTLGGQQIQYPQGFFLGRGERIALSMIRDTMDERPIHFASTGGLAQTLGLDRWAVRQGLSSRLRIENLDAAPEVIRVSPALGGEWVDLDRSLALTQRVHRYRGLVDRPVWQDGATVNIPFQFYYMYLQMADAAVVDGRNVAEAEALALRADDFLITFRGGTRIAGVP